MPKILRPRAGEGAVGLMLIACGMASFASTHNPEEAGGFSGLAIVPAIAAGLVLLTIGFSFLAIAVNRRRQARGRG